MEGSGHPFPAFEAATGTVNRTERNSRLAFGAGSTGVVGCTWHAPIRRRAACDLDHCDQAGRDDQDRGDRGNCNPRPTPALATGDDCRRIGQVDAVHCRECTFAGLAPRVSTLMLLPLAERQRAARPAACRWTLTVDSAIPSVRGDLRRRAVLEVVERHALALAPGQPSNRAPEFVVDDLGELLARRPAARPAAGALALHGIAPAGRSMPGASPRRAPTARDRRTQRSSTTTVTLRKALPAPRPRLSLDYRSTRLREPARAGTERQRSRRR